MDGVFFGDHLKNFCEDLFFWRTFALVSLVLGLGLEHSCPWPREGLSSERLSLALASDFFVSLALASSLVSSTPPLALDLQDRDETETLTNRVSRLFRDRDMSRDTTALGLVVKGASIGNLCN